MAIPRAYREPAVSNSQAWVILSGIMTLLLAAIFAVTIPFGLSPLIPVTILGYAYVYSIMNALPAWLFRILAGSVYNPVVSDIGLLANWVFFGIDSLALAMGIYGMIGYTFLGTEFVTQAILVVFLFFFWVLSAGALYFNNTLVSYL